MSSGSDCAWIDNVVFPASSVITEVVEVVENNGVKVYPNPANNVINIQLGNASSDVEIYNSLGQTVRRIESASGDIQVKIDELTEGIYFIKANGTVIKVVKR